jgi:hypothetical protein
MVRGGADVQEGEEGEAVAVALFEVAIGCFFTRFLNIIRPLDLIEVQLDLLIFTGLGSSLVISTAIEEAVAAVAVAATGTEVVGLGL